MKKLVESQFEENQVNENELEEIYGGSGEGCGCEHTGCRGRHAGLSDEDDAGTIIF